MIFSLNKIPNVSPKLQIDLTFSMMFKSSSFCLTFPDAEIERINIWSEKPTSNWHKANTQLLLPDTNSVYFCIREDQP